VGGYTIAYAMLLITGARIGDRYGRRRTYLAGVLVFTAASLACALAPDSQALIGFRFVQGAGAAVLVPQVFSIIQLTFTGPARARALSAYAAVLSAGAVAGLVLGGVVVTANLFGTSWRPIFAINVPLGIVLALLVPRLVPPDESPAEPRATRSLDLAGLLAAACSILLIVLPLVLGREAGWTAWCSGSVAAGAALAAVFVLIERRVAARGLAGHRPGGAGRQRSRLPGHRGRPARLRRPRGHRWRRRPDLGRTGHGRPRPGAVDQPAARAALPAAGAGHSMRALASAGAMSGTACWLAALSAAGLLAATIMVRAARGRPRSLPAGLRARRSGYSHWDQGDRRARVGGSRINSSMM
jgi:MFS family permease